MHDVIQLGNLTVLAEYKAVKNVHLSVHPPKGHVTLVAPLSTRPDVARAYVISRLNWIRQQQARMVGQARENPRLFVDRESHYLWGRRHLLRVKEVDAKPFVTVGQRHITLHLRSGSDHDKRAELIHAWHKAQLHEVVPDFISQWAPRLGVQVSGYFLQRMKTKWGSCNPTAGNIRLNTELVKKPKDLLEYVIVHEMAHLIEPTHTARFVAILDRHYPAWREARSELNALPLTAFSY